MSKTKLINVGNFSGGRTSAFMMENLLAGGWAGKIVFSNTGLEAEETLLFVKQCGERWAALYGVEVVWIEFDRQAGKLKKDGKPGIGRPFAKVVNFETASREGEPFLKLFEPRKDLPNRVWRECTKNLKIKNLKRYLKTIRVKSWTSFNGIRYDEPERWDKSTSFAEADGYEIELPLVAWKTTKPDVLSFWQNMPFNLALEDDVFGNCDLCFLKGPNKRMEVMRRKPQLAAFWIRLERQKKRTFVKNISTEMLLEKALKGGFVYDPAENFDTPCTCNVD